MFRQLILLALASMVFCQGGSKKFVPKPQPVIDQGNELDQYDDASTTPQPAVPVKPVVSGRKPKPAPVKPAEGAKAPVSPYDSLSIAELLSRPLDTEALQQILVRAEPGKDYPIYSMDAMPETSFSCANVHYPGYYADVQTDCQVFHFCPPQIEGAELVPQTFLCPNLTRFNNRVLVCDWFFNVDCKGAEALFDLANSRLYQTALPLLDDVDMGMPQAPVSAPKKPTGIKRPKVKQPVKAAPVKPVEDEQYDAEQ